MQEISKITNSSAIQTSTPVKGEIKPNDTCLKQDEVHFSTKKKVAIGAAITGALASAATLAVMIGRNPAKAAKVLKGHTNIANDVYKEGQKFADEIINKEGNFKTTIDDVLKIFKAPEHQTGLHEDISTVEKLMKEQNIVPDEATQKAFKNIKLNLNKRCADVKEQMIAGKEKPDIDSGKRFYNENSEDFKTIEDFLHKQSSDDLYKSASKFSSYEAPYSIGMRPGVFECPNGVLPNNGVFFHGTRKAGKVYKNGFSPFASNQVETAGRELGAGVYITPDVGVASYFSGMFGDIIPVKLAQGSKVAMVTEGTHKAMFEVLSKFIEERMPAAEFSKLPKGVKNTTNECLMRNIFKKAGYDAAYTPKGYRAGGGLLGNLFQADINQVIGRQQSQLAVFSPEKLEIAPRTFKERVCDLKDKFNSLKAMINYSKEHPLGF